MENEALTAKELFYASKPLACSSAIIVRKDGKEYRHHPGYYMGYHMIERPSYYTTDVNEYKPQHDVWTETKKKSWEEIWN